MPPAPDLSAKRRVSGARGSSAACPSLAQYRPAPGLLPARPFSRRRALAAPKPPLLLRPLCRGGTGAAPRPRPLTPPPPQAVATRSRRAPASAARRRLLAAAPAGAAACAGPGRAEQQEPGMRGAAEAEAGGCQETGTARKQEGGFVTHVSRLRVYRRSRQRVASAATPRGRASAEEAAERAAG